MKPLLLDWPPKELQPNARCDRRRATRIRKSYKETCAWLAKFAGKPAIDGTLALTLIFHPPTAHHRDLDNCLAAAKYALDGVANGWGVDDRVFRPLILDFGQIVPGGAIEVRV